jgi:hypothetical protein
LPRIELLRSSIVGVRLSSVSPRVAIPRRWKTRVVSGRASAEAVASKKRTVGSPSPEPAVVTAVLGPLALSLFAVCLLLEAGARRTVGLCAASPLSNRRFGIGRELRLTPAAPLNGRELAPQLRDVAVELGRVRG